MLFHHGSSVSFGSLCNCFSSVARGKLFETVQLDCSDQRPEHKLGGARQVGQMQTLFEAQGGG